MALPQGERSRLGLARALPADAKLLVLDKSLGAPIRSPAPCWPGVLWPEARALPMIAQPRAVSRFSPAAVWSRVGYDLTRAIIRCLRVERNGIDANWSGCTRSQATPGGRVMVLPVAINSDSVAI